MVNKNIGSPNNFRNRKNIMERTTGSKRAKAVPPKLIVIKGKCKYCGNNKLLESTNITKCSKCKRWQR